MSKLADCELPGIIWMYWEQGLENAPDVVRQCHQSWLDHNPGWKVVMLDRDTVSEYVDLPAVIGRNYHGLPIQNRSDILRLNLLARFGGVWADATCLCNRPLDGWIHEYMKSGFFAFRDPGRGRVISSWFMAACAGNPLIASFSEAHNAYWRQNVFPSQKTAFRKFLIRRLRVLIGKRPERQDIWLSWPVRRILRIFPYFIVHYHFGYHVRHNPESGKIFSAMPYFSAKPASLKMIRMLGKRCPPALQAYADGDIPVSKLNWKKAPIAAGLQGGDAAGITDRRDR